MISVVVDGLQIERMHATLRLPAQKVLDQGPDYTLITEASTTATISLDAGGLILSFRAPLRFVLHPASAGPLAHLVEDVRWSRARYLFRRPGRPPLPTRTANPPRRRRQPVQPSVDAFRRSHPARVEISLTPVRAWLAFDVARQEVQWMLEEKIEDLFEGHPISAPDYDPTKDPNLEANIASLAELLGGSGESGDGADALRGLGATVRLVEGFSNRDSDTEVELAPDTSVQVSVSTTVSGCTGLLRLSSADFEFGKPLRVRSGENRLEISHARVEVTPEGPKVVIEPRGMRVTGGPAHAVAGAGALIGLLAASLGGGQSQGALAYGAQQGAGVGDAVLAGAISGIATRAVGEALERMRPRLKERAPLVDWDGLFADTQGRPACQEPVSRR